MKPTNQNLGLNQESDSVREPRPWLQKHYQEKRERTIRLVKAAVDQLIKEQQAVTIEAICRKSTEVDPDGRGIKKSAILENKEAHAYYCEHSTSYRNAQTRKRQGTKKRERKTALAQPLRIDPNRDRDRVRYRYLQLTKAEMVERLLIVEQAYVDVHQQLAHLQFQLLEQQEKEQRQAQHHSKQKGGTTSNRDGAENP
jgi:hypothetical protein